MRFEGEDLLALPANAMARVRGRRIAMVFQNPASSLNPLYTVGAQLGEILRAHERVGRGRGAGAGRRSCCGWSGFSDPAARLRQYPHELSGGMKQRVGIARALLCNPALVLADEPTTALDVTIQAQILDLLSSCGSGCGMSMILVTHDMGVVARMADRITVMYAGRVCESGECGARSSRAAASLYARAAREHAARSIRAIGGRRAVLRDDRRGGRPDMLRSAERLPVPDAVPGGDGGMRAACCRVAGAQRSDPARVGHCA